MHKKDLVAGLLGADRAAALKRRSAHAQLRRGMEAFGDIASIFSVGQREQADFILIRDMLVHDAKALMGLKLVAEKNFEATNDEVSLAFAEGSGFSMAEQFEIGRGVAKELHKELNQLRAKSGSTADATARTEEIMAEYGIDKRVPAGEHTEYKKKIRKLLMREYSDAEYDQMRAYLSTDRLTEPANEVQEFAALALGLSEHRLNQGGMQAISNLCGFISGANGVEPGVVDLYDEMLATPMLISAMPKAHAQNTAIIKKCDEALPVLREAAAAFEKHYPEKSIAEAYIAPSNKIFREAEHAIESLPNREPVKGALERLGGIDEQSVLGGDNQINVELGKRIDNASGMARSMIGATTAYTEGGTGLGKTIRPLRNKLNDHKPDETRAKILKGGKVPDEHKDAIFTFRAIETLYDTYMDMGRQEVEQIQRMRTEYAGRLTAPQEKLLDQMEKDYAVLHAEVPKAQEALQAAYQNLTQGMVEDDYFIGRFKVERLAAYLESFKEAALRREEKFKRFEEKHPPKKAEVAPA